MRNEAVSAQREIALKPCWRARLEQEFSADYMQELRSFLRSEQAAGKRIFPPGPEIFNALNSTPFESVKVVVLGQDPYHGPGQAHGLSFSVKPGVAIPPSLRNIYKELAADIGVKAPRHGCLQHWADQGVLLLNAVLTVEAQRAASHQGRGWERFTDRVVATLNEERQGLVFLLWGSHAQKKGATIDRERHLVLRCPHPSPLSASRGFFGNHHFSRANDYLIGRGQEPIDWQLPEQAHD